MKDVILGLDVSTSKVGLCIMDYECKLLESEVIKLKTADELEDRCIFLENYLNDINNKEYCIKSIFIESPFIMFSGGKTTAVTMSKLQRFNGMVSYMTRRSFEIQPVLIAANKARGLVGLKIKRGENTKQKVIEHIERKYPNEFTYELTRYGNPKPGTDDRADAVVIAWAGLLL
jgi:Holliday junction resolvasome RuvABC endonuclease subunit|tara:strand:- start:344 stop:865 length:522 start_codon:yes stop_codon:yes gene_type:complete